MSAITIEAVQAKQTELDAMIQQLLAQANTCIVIDACTIQLQPGEHYAGAVLDANGKHLHHLVLMAQRPEEDLDWQAAMEWAAGIGGALPNRQEQALLYANCKPHLKAEWHWSSETYEGDASYAWYCGFLSGGQSINRTSSEGSAVAVRRV